MNKTFIVAELSANHNHNLQTAVDTIKAAAKAGADAVKIQTYSADTLTLDCRNPEFVIKGGLWDGYSLYDLYKEAFTPWEWHEELFKVAKEEGLIIFSTPFDKTSVDFLESLNNPIYKIASFEITDVNLIQYAASKGKPMIISTGVATTEEVEDAIQYCHLADNNDITLLKCTSAYPADIKEANLSMIPAMREKFNVPVGLSDHSLGSLLPIVAVSLGATVIEKHFILDRKIGGPDSAFSMEATAFAEMVKRIRETEEALGEISFQTDVNEIKGRDFRRSLYASADIKSGEIITEENIKSVRPGFGLSPKFLKDIIGKKANGDIKFGTPLRKEDIADFN